MFAIALGMSPIEKITVAISASIFIIAFTWVSIKGDLRKLANELIEDNENTIIYLNISTNHLEGKGLMLDLLLEKKIY